MNDLESRLRAYGEVLDRAAVEQQDDATTVADRHRPNRRTLLALAAAVTVAALGVFSLVGDDNRTQVRTTSGPDADLSTVPLPVPVASTAVDTDGFRLWIMTADGRRQVPVTDFYPEASALGAAWSPDGTRVAFHDGKGIMVINADGSDLRRLPGPVGLPGPAAADPAWSPDGTRIAFTGHQYSDSGPDVYVMNVDGTGVTRLGVGRYPAWSPDGSRIAFEHNAVVSAERPIYQVGVMNSDGSDWTLFPVLEREGGTVSVGAPAWSPDGQWLAFQGYPATEGARWSAIYRSRPDGRDLKEVVRQEATPVAFSAVSGAAWSPDGRWIAYSAGDGGIRLVDHETGQTRDLAVAQRDPQRQGRGPQDLDATWSPDGTRIAFFRFGDFHPPTQ